VRVIIIVRVILRVRIRRRVRFELDLCINHFTPHISKLKYTVEKVVISPIGFEIRVSFMV